jgi:hypothetical protein
VKLDVVCHPWDLDRVSTVTLVHTSLGSCVCVCLLLQDLGRIWDGGFALASTLSLNSLPDGVTSVHATRRRVLGLVR